MNAGGARVLTSRLVRCNAGLARKAGDARCHVGTHAPSCAPRDPDRKGVDGRKTASQSLMHRGSQALRIACASWTPSILNSPSPQFWLRWGRGEFEDQKGGEKEKPAVGGDKFITLLHVQPGLVLAPHLPCTFGGAPPACFSFTASPDCLATVHREECL